MASVCVFTMVYNESENLRRWLTYYQEQLGTDATLIVDNGSDDESVDLIRSSRNMLFPRTIFSNNLRASFVSELTRTLLLVYDTVIYTDCDEFIVANPEKYESLGQFLSQNSASALTGLGYDLVHVTDLEPDLHSDEPLLSVRHHLKPLRAMCKTLITRKPIKWGGGFHTSDAYPTLDEDLWIFHTKSADFQQRLRRQAITRTVVRDDNSGEHQRWDDSKLAGVFSSFNKAAKEPFVAEARRNYVQSLTKAIERKYYEHSDIVKYSFSESLVLPNTLLYTDNSFKHLF